MQRVKKNGRAILVSKKIVFKEKCLSSDSYLLKPQ